MLELMLIPLQFIVFAFFCADKNVTKFSVALALAFILNDIVNIEWLTFYLEQAAQDVLMLLCCLLLKDKNKRLLLISICLVSFGMNIHEHCSYYQSFFYEYRNVLQWWMVELMFVITIWNTKWRKMSCLYSQKRLSR